MPTDTTTSSAITPEVVSQVLSIGTNVQFCLYILVWTIFVSVSVIIAYYLYKLIIKTFRSYIRF